MSSGTGWPQCMMTPSQLPRTKSFCALQAAALRRLFTFTFCTDQNSHQCRQLLQMLEAESADAMLHDVACKHAAYIVPALMASLTAVRDVSVGDSLGRLAVHLCGAASFLTESMMTRYAISRACKQCSRCAYRLARCSACTLPQTCAVHGMQGPGTPPASYSGMLRIPGCTVMLAQQSCSWCVLA